MGSAGFFPGLEMGITVSNRQSSGKTPAVQISLCNLWLDFVQCLRRKHSGQTDEQTDGGDYNTPFVFFKKKRGDNKVVMAVILVVVRSQLNLVFLYERTLDSWQTKTISTIEERGSKIDRNSVFDCHFVASVL